MKPGINTESEVKNSQPQVAGKSSGGITTAAAMSIAVALGLSNTAPAALTMTGSPVTLTMSGSTVHTGAGIEQSTKPGVSRQYFDNTIQTAGGPEVTGMGTMTINISAAIAGIGGTLTVEGESLLVTGEYGFANQTATIGQTILYGKTGGTMTTFSPPVSTRSFTNNNIADFAGAGENIYQGTHILFTIPVTAGGGSYTIQSIGTMQGGDGTVLLAGDLAGNTGLKLTYTMVPEPGTLLSAAVAALVAAGLRGRRPTAPSAPGTPEA